MTRQMHTHNVDVTYHIRPPHGLLNDPNGLIYFNGLYHVFFQWNQKGTTHKNKSWGHAVSEDLTSWRYLPPALEPTAWFDKDGCYSGSAVEADGRMYLFYTGNVRGENGERESYQCLAVSEDGETFEKKGPLFEQPAGYTAHIRDPKVWKEDDTWWMLLGAQTETLEGTAILYRSDNLLDWTYAGELMERTEPFGYMWECPDLLRLDERDVFVFSPQGLEPEGDFYQNIFQTGYLSGTFTKKGTFQSDAYGFKELDRGFEFYAPQSFVDNQGRTLLFGWMGAMEPEVEQAVPTIQDGWVHHLSLPREISWENERLIQRPAEELKQLRKEAVPLTEVLDQSGKASLPSLQSELVLEWQEADNFELTLRGEVTLFFNKEKQRVTVERTNWLTKESETRSVALNEALTDMRIFLEASSLELFINGGREVFSLRYFTETENSELTWKSTRPVQATAYPLDTATSLRF
ncbi:glycoside hydrolase family 32 protein [Atopococcus tabaci]|uniref:glycoside hydrolase family 32 protein n=1 Tax=Atopococcus tabaci TaxID=269774 RepID=UPI0004072044|nr:glycoside hydrolase family 32 protein [Atopococcus tabaci]